MSLETRQEIIAKKLRFFAIDAGAVAQACGLGGRINTIMQVCFFALSKVLPRAAGAREHQEGHQEVVRKTGR